MRNIFTIMECVLTFAGAMVLMIWYSPLLTFVAVVLALLPLIASVLTGNKVAEAEKMFLTGMRFTRSHCGTA